MVAIGAAITAGAGVYSANQAKKGGKLRKISTMNKEQKALFTMLVANVLGVDASILAENKNNIMHLLQSGEFDDILDLSADDPRVAEKVFQGDRVADLTPSQQSIMKNALGHDFQFQDTAAMFDHLDKTGEIKQMMIDMPDTEAPFQTPEGAQIVGENGPEVLDPNQAVDIIPADETSDIMKALEGQRDNKADLILNRENLQKTRGDLQVMRNDAMTEHDIAQSENRASNFDERNHVSGMLRARARRQEGSGIDLGSIASFADPAVGLTERFVNNNSSVLPQVAEDGLNAVDEFDPAGVNNSDTSTRSGTTVDANGNAIVDDFNPLGTETNTVGLDPQDLLDSTGLQGKADGGELNPNEKAVVGEEGPELAVPKGTLDKNITGATNRALSGKPSTEINEGTTTNLINKAIVNPLNQQFKENTLPSIGASVAGAGFSGSQRVKATQRASDQLNRTIGEQSAKLRFDDERARRDLAESAANRSASSIPTALDVGNMDLARRTGEANIASTQAGTALTEFDTKRGETLLDSEVQSADIAIDSALQGLELGEAAIEKMKQAAKRDIAELGRFSEETTRLFEDGGIRDQELAKLVADIDSVNTSTIANRGDAVADNNAAMLSHYNSLLDIAGIEQDQDQAEIDADILHLAETNQALADAIQAFRDLLQE